MTLLMKYPLSLKRYFFEMPKVMIPPCFHFLFLPVMGMWPCTNTHSLLPVLESSVTREASLVTMTLQIQVPAHTMRAVSLCACLCVTVTNHMQSCAKIIYSQGTD